MRHVFGMISQALAMAITYISVMLSLVLDALVFGFPILLIYNFTLVNKFSAPELTYIDIFGLVFLIKILAVLWKSVKIVEPYEEYLDKQKLNEQKNG